MRLGRYLSALNKPELDNLKLQLNLTDDEELVFLHLSKGRSKQSTADNCKISISTVDLRIKSIKNKLLRLEGVNIV